MNRPMLVPIMLALSLDAGADMLNKCISADGKVEYRDYACDVSAASAQKITVRENTSGSGQDLASIRQRDAEFNRRQAAKRSAQDAADRQERIEAQRRFEEARVYRDRQVVIDGTRESGAPNYDNTPPSYNSRLPNANNVPYDQRTQLPATPVVPATPPKPSSSVPAQPKRPNG